MSDDEATGPLERELLRRDSAPYDGVMGRLPDWVPENFHREFQTVRDRLLKKYTHEHLLDSIAKGIAEAHSIRGMLTDKPLDLTEGIFEFSEVRGVRAASFLARLQKAVSMGEDAGLALLTDIEHAGLASHGKQMRNGRKKGTGGPIRKWIARQLSKNQTMKNRDLWAAIKRNPPRGWQAMENRQGKYLDGPRTGNVAKNEMSYGRFSNVAKEERDKLKR